MPRRELKHEPLSQGQIIQAQYLRNSKQRGVGPLSWWQVADQMRVARFRLLAHFDPEFLAKERERMKKNRALYNKKILYGYHVPNNGSTGGRVNVPPHVIEEMERRNAAPQTLNQIYFGDPPVGFSALDKRRA